MSWSGAFLRHPVHGTPNNIFRVRLDETKFSSENEGGGRDEAMVTDFMGKARPSRPVRTRKAKRQDASCASSALRNYKLEDPKRRLTIAVQR